MGKKLKKYSLFYSQDSELSIGQLEVEFNESLAGVMGV